MNDRENVEGLAAMLLLAALGLLFLDVAGRRRKAASSVRAFRRLESELEAERERADAAEAAAAELRRRRRPGGVPEPRESVTPPEEPGAEADD